MDHRMRNPYRRLDPFTEKDHGLFFGREDELSRLLDQVQAHDVTVLLGDRNVGKTSLLRAGLTPKLEELGYTVVYVGCLDSPVLRIQEALERLELGRIPIQSTSLLALLQNIVQRTTCCVLLLDHAEQLFTRASNEERHQFMLDIASLLRHGNSRLKLVVSMRQDLAYHLLELSAQVPDLYHRDHTLHLAGLRRESAYLALTAPSARTAFPFPAEVAQVCLDDLGQAYDLPDLQILGFELFEFAQRHNRPVTLTDYYAIGRSPAILDQFFAAMVDN